MIRCVMNVIDDSDMKHDINVIVRVTAGNTKATRACKSNVGDR
jgi:hypothetical protein